MYSHSFIPKFLYIIIKKRKKNYTFSEWLVIKEPSSHSDIDVAGCYDVAGFNGYGIFDVSDGVPDGVSDDVSDGVSDDVPGDVPDGVSDDFGNILNSTLK